MTGREAIAILESEGNEDESDLIDAQVLGANALRRLPELEAESAEARAEVQKWKRKWTQLRAYLTSCAWAEVFDVENKMDRLEAEGE